MAHLQQMLQEDALLAAKGLERSFVFSGPARGGQFGARLSNGTGRVDLLKKNAGLLLLVPGDHP